MKVCPSAPGHSALMGAGAGAALLVAADELLAEDDEVGAEAAADEMLAVDDEVGTEAAADELLMAADELTTADDEGPLGVTMPFNTMSPISALYRVE